MAEQPASETEINEAGMERLQADVDAVPPDQQALGLVEAIQEQTQMCWNKPAWALRLKLGVIQGNAERLIALLERQAEEKAALLALLERALQTYGDDCPANAGDSCMWAKARAAIAKGGAP